MNLLTAGAGDTNVWFDENNMWISFEDGRVLATPKAWLPKLLDASDEELEDYEISGGGIGLHWDSLDEDISVHGLLMGYGAVQKRVLAK